MSEREWRPKVGDKVMVVGHPSLSGQFEIRGVEGLLPGWYRVCGFQQEVHLRNLDPVLEDERKGAPRPPIQAGDEVEVILRGKVYLGGRGLLVTNASDSRIPAGWNDLPLACDPRVRQIERRGPNLGREARKS